MFLYLLRAIMTPDDRYPDWVDWDCDYAQVVSAPNAPAARIQADKAARPSGPWLDDKLTSCVRIGVARGNSKHLYHVVSTTLLTANRGA